MFKRRRSGLEDLVEIAARLPWWVGIGLAVVSYLVLHEVALMEVAVPRGMEELGGFAALQLYKTLATFGQYLLPGAFVLGATGSVVGRWKRRCLLVQAGKGRDALAATSWRDFELLDGPRLAQMVQSVQGEPARTVGPLRKRRGGFGAGHPMGRWALALGLGVVVVGAFLLLGGASLLPRRQAPVERAVFVSVPHAAKVGGPASAAGERAYAPDAMAVRRELERRFEAEYVAPADCAQWRSQEHMVECANHQTGRGGSSWRAMQRPRTAIRPSGNGLPCPF